MARVARAVVVTLVVVLSAVGCGGGGAHRAARPLPPPPPSAPIAAPPPTAPPPPPASIVATASVPSVKVFPAPGAPAPTSSLANPNDYGLPLVFLVRSVQGDWLQVMLPQRPNGATGWIRSSDVTLARDDWRMQVELGAHRLTVWKGADVVRQEPVAVGTQAAPTPVGDFYLTELLDTGNPGGAYGPYAFGLSAFSDVYTSFAGGPGQIGLHGTNSPGGLGHNVSHGCVRVANAAILAMAREVPVGTPVSIVA